MPAYFGKTRFWVRLTTSICIVGLLFACSASSSGDTVSRPDHSSASGGMSSADARAVLDAHNQARAEVGVKPLVWSTELAAIASIYATKLARTGQFKHSGQGSYGENLFMGTAGAYGPVDGVRSWVGEKQDYDYNANHGHGKVVGHYTQVVWSGTTAVGCGQAVGYGSMWMVCNYYPAGNIVGQRPY